MMAAAGLDKPNGASRTTALAQGQKPLPGHSLACSWEFLPTQKTFFGGRGIRGPARGAGPVT